MNNPVIPHNYETWQHCITVECELELTADYIRQRIKLLQNDKDYHTQQIIRLYGQQHRQNVLRWFRQAQNSI